MVSLKIILPLGAALIGLLALAGCKLTRAGYETLDYKVVRKNGAFEIRDYPAAVLVSTPMSPGSKEGDDSFMRLFRYIGGANEKEAKIAMTTPVFMDKEGTNRLMSFVVPKKTASQGAPKAAAENISLGRREQGRFAVYRFSGSVRGGNTDEAVKKLADWMDQEHLPALEKPQVAAYDPPFMPPFLRRNEVMVRIKQE